MVCLFPSKLLLCCGIFTWFVVIKSEENTLSACEIEKLLKPLLSPPYDQTIQAQALRQRLLNLLRQEQDDVEEGFEERDSEKWNELPAKRSLQSLARDGYLKRLPDIEEMDENELNLKRSIQNLAKNNQFPDMNDPKRNIASLARNGELNYRRDIENLIDELNQKRNIGSLAREFNFPSYGKRFLGSLARSGDLRFEGKRQLPSIMRNGKRNLASIARSNSNLYRGYDEYKRNIGSLAKLGGKFVGKRNVAALLRQDNYANEHHQHDGENRTEKPENDSEEGENNKPKRNLASIKAKYTKRSLGDYNEGFNARRNKREVDYYEVENEEYPQAAYQGRNGLDYEELVGSLVDDYRNPEKRFLGRLPQMGKPKTTPTPKVRRRRINDFY